MMSDLVFLAHRMPYPPDKGEKIRAYHALRHFAGRFRVHLGCLVDDREDEKHLPQLREICVSVRAVPLNRLFATARSGFGIALGGSISENYFRDVRLTSWLADTVGRFRPEGIFVFSSAMAPYAIPYASSHRVVVDMVDVDSEKWRAYGMRTQWPMNRLYAREAHKLLALERKAAKFFEHSLFVSRAERDLFHSLAPESTSRIGYYENGVDLDYFSPAHSFGNPFGGKTAIVFTGTMSYRPNVEAVEWFARRVFPRIRARHSKAEFWIVGANPASAVARLSRLPSVRVTGRVADVRPYLAHAACVVAPLFMARGVQNKILEAMAMASRILF